MGHAERANPQGRHATFQLPIEVQDRLGRPLHEGDLVLLKVPDQMLTWRVTGIGAELDPHAPPNMVTLSLTAQFRATIPTRQAVQDVIRIRTAQEGGEPPAVVQHFPAPPKAWWRRMLSFT